jgi:hypothetical protein
MREFTKIDYFNTHQRSFLHSLDNSGAAASFEKLKAVRKVVQFSMACISISRHLNEVIFFVA